jgi:hypothetical protein
MSDEAKTFLKSHDIAHVVIGYNTSIIGEGIVKIWTTFGTELSFWEVVKGIKSVNAFSLSQNYSAKHVVENLFRLIVTIPKAIK